MRRYPTGLTATVVALCLLLAACGGPEEMAATTGLPTTSLAPATTTLAPTTTLAAAPTTTTAAPTTTVPAPSPEVTADSGASWTRVWLGLSPEGFPLLVYGTEAGGDGYGVLRLAACPDPYCAGPIAVTDLHVAEESWAIMPSFEAAIGPAGWPVVVYTAFDTAAFWDDPSLCETWVVQCTDSACTSPTMSQVGPWPDPEATDSWDKWGTVAGAEVAAGGSDRVLVEYEWSGGHRLFACDLSGCPEDRLGDMHLGDWILDGLVVHRFGVGPDGRPSLVQAGLDGWVLTRCDDADCGQVTVSDIPWHSPPSPLPGARNLALLFDAGGLPMIAYDTVDREGYSLWLARCLDPACGAFEETVLVARRYSTVWTIATDAEGRPTVAWLEGTWAPGYAAGGELMLTRCVDAVCAALETAGTGFLVADMAGWAAALRADGEPVVVVSGEGGLRLFNCLPDVCTFRPEG